MRKSLHLLCVLFLVMGLCGCTQAEPFTVWMAGYETLENDAERQVYDTLDAQVQKLTPEVFVIPEDVSLRRLVQIIDIYCMDHPEVFWINEQMSLDTQGLDQGSVRLVYLYEGEILQNMKEAQEEAIQSFLASIAPDASAYEKELAVNEWIIDHAEYDHDAVQDNQYTVRNVCYGYGALVDGWAICEGYARAFKILCDRAAVPCTLVLTRMLDNGIGHMLNAVQLDGEWYYADVTNNDHEQYCPAVEHMRYLNETEEMLLKRMSIEPTYAESSTDTRNMLHNIFVPSCTSEEYNCLMREIPEMSVNRYNEEIIPAAAEAARSGKTWFALRVPEEEDYEDFRTWMFEDNHIRDFLQSVSMQDGVPALDIDANGCWVRAFRLIGVNLIVKE